MYKSKIENYLPEIIELYNSGMSCREIAKLYDCSYATISYQLKQRGYTMRKIKGIKHCVNNRRIVNTEIFTSKEGTPEFDYILGILATDGNIYKNSIKIEQSDENVEILKHFQDFLENKVSIKQTKHRDKSYNYIGFKNQDICDYLSSFGITPNKSFTLKLKYINWDVLRGVFDGDGCLVMDPRKNKSWRFSITSASIDFIQQLETFLKENGLHPLIYKENTYFIIHIGKLSEIYYIYQHLYKDSSYFLTRKYEKFCPLVEKFTSSNSVNSVKERENYETEPSLLTEEGAETWNGTPK